MNAGSIFLLALEHDSADSWFFYRELTSARSRTPRTLSFADELAFVRPSCGVDCTLQNRDFSL